MFLVISTSLDPQSKSFILAKAAIAQLQKQNIECELLDLREIELPMCDGGACYEQPIVSELSAKITEAQGILIAAPVYVYDVAASTKNLIELTGKAWSDKVVGFLLAAGGRSSYMSVMGIANSLMLDFRSIILPRFVYATRDAFQAGEIVDEAIECRIEELTKRLVQIGTVVSGKDILTK